MSQQVDKKWDEYKTSTSTLIFYCKDNSKRWTSRYSTPSGTISMSYHVTPFDDLVDLMANVDQRFFHEMICPGVPCRLYLDLDGKGIDMNSEEHLEVVRFARGRVRDVYIALFNTEPSDDPVVLSSTRKGHVSLHIIWNIWFEHVGHVKEFVLKAFPEKKIKGLEVDIGLYPNRRPKPFRLPFSGKHVSGTCMFHAVPLEDKNAPFSARLFCLGSVTFHSSHSTRYELPVMGPLHSLDSISDVTLSFATGVTNPNYATQKMVFEEISARYQCEPVSGIQVMENETFKFRTQMCCPVQGRFHRSNGQIIYSDDLGGIYSLCLDEDCRKIRYKFPFTVQSLALSKERIEIDWMNKRIKM